VNLSTKKDPNTWVNKVSNKNDLFSRTHEDPFLAIKMAEKQVSHYCLFPFLG
jgi:hypothetical protein